METNQEVYTSKDSLIAAYKASHKRTPTKQEWKAFAESMAKSARLPLSIWTECFKYPKEFEKIPQEA